MKNVVMDIFNTKDSLFVTSNGNEFSAMFGKDKDGNDEIHADFILKCEDGSEVTPMNVLCGAPYTINDILYYFKRQHMVSVKKTLPAFPSYTKGSILDIKFESGADLSVTVPENSHYTYFSGTNSCYIFRDIDSPNMKDTIIGDMVNAIYSSKNGQYKLMVDYTCNECFILDRMDNVIGTTKFGKDIYELSEALYKDYGKINYVYDNSILMDIKKDYEDSDLFCIRADMLNEEDEVDKIIVVYPVPYIVTLDELYIFSEDTKLYVSEEYNVDDDETLRLTAQNFCVLDSEGEKELCTQWVTMLSQLSEEGVE